MATTYYVSADAVGGNDGLTEALPLTLAEAIALTGTGNTCWIKEGAYTTTTGATTVTAGDMTGFNTYIGYTSTIGDLSNQGRNTDGSLNTTNFPTITVTDSWSIPSYIVMANLDISGSYAGDMLGTSESDNLKFINCKLQNDGDSTLCTIIRSDDALNVINCDLYGPDTGTCGSLVRNDYYSLISSCRIIVTATVGTAIFRINVPSVVGCYISGNGQPLTSITSTSGSGFTLFAYNTIYNCGTVVLLPNASMSVVPILVGNHVTDSDTWVNNQYSATSNVITLEINNRLRDVTTLRTGIGDNVVLNEVDTDTGGPETDYTDYTSNDLSLIDNAVGVDTGLGFGSWNIGAQQDSRESTVVTGGGIINGNMTGGFGS